MHFDVLTEPWIPATDEEGEELEFGLLDLLANAHKLREVVDPAPPIQLGLYRFLIAFVQDALELRELEDLEDALAEGRFDLKVFEAYVERVGRNRFDLFDPMQPFLQSQPIREATKKRKSVVELFYHLPTGTNVIHFYHVNEGDHSVSSAVAARALCSIAPFMTAGGAGYSPSINGSPPWYVLALGSNLFETILYNCCTMEVSGLDWQAPPAWASNSPLVPRAEKPCSSLAEGYTWQPRQVNLIASEGGVCSYSGQVSDVLVYDMIWGPGHKFGGQDTWRDPQVAYEHDRKRGVFPLRPREGRALWRDYGPLFLLRKEDTATRVFSRPAILSQMALLKDERIVPRDKAEQFEVYGMRVDKAKVFEWYYERLPLSTGLLSNPEAGVQVQYAMELAEQVARSLGYAMKRLYPRDASGNAKALDRLIQGAQMQFWSLLEVYFTGPFLLALGRQDPKDEAARQELFAGWKDYLKTIGWACLEDALRTIETGAKALERQVWARASFARGVAKVLGGGRTEYERSESKDGSSKDVSTPDSPIH